MGYFITTSDVKEDELKRREVPKVEGTSSQNSIDIIIRVYIEYIYCIQENIIIQYSLKANKVNVFFM